MQANDIIRSYKSARDRFQQDLGAHRRDEAEHQKSVEKLSRMNEDIQVTELALKILEGVALQVEHLIHARIDEPVTAALQTIYQRPDLKLRTTVNRAGDRMEASFEIGQDSGTVTGPVLDSVGGGVIDIISFVLRLCIYRLEDCKGPIVMDEPFRHVDSSALWRAAQFAKQLSHDMGIQIVAVTHEKPLEMSADNVIRFTGEGVAVQNA